MRALRRDEGYRVPFDAVTIFLHWATVILIVFQAGTGLSLEFAERSIPTKLFLDIHRSTGMAIWLIAFSRLLWRSWFARFPPFPAWMSGLQKWLARRTEHVLYALLLFQPISGLSMTLMFGKPFRLFLWTVPAMSWANFDYFPLLQTIHLVGAYCMFAVIGGHAGMALVHQYVFKDDVLEKMAPWVKQKKMRARVALVITETPTNS